MSQLNQAKKLPFYLTWKPKVRKPAPQVRLDLDAKDLAKLRELVIAAGKVA